jgi:4-amino-4-deoxy-L-arabinose transferase-like glycosyltransferase
LQLACTDLSTVDLADTPVAPSWSPAGIAAAARSLAPLLAAIALAAVLNLWALGQNGYANVYYSAGVKSMLLSWHNFFFVSADPSGLITIDKPPLGLWLQAASAELFGFSPLSLLLPQALAGVASVAALYLIVRKRYGTPAATAAALTLAVFPAFVAVARDNNLDALLILLMTLACGTALRAIETGRLRWLLATAVLVALAFNTKALAACLVIPGIAAGYLCCAPARLRRRIGALLLAGVVCAVLSLAWMLAVDLTPASQRPFVGSSTDNSELGLTFGYNGFGRVGGQKGGPGAVANREVQPLVQAPAAAGGASAASVRLPTPSPDVAPKLAATITRSPVAFGTAPGPLRLFRHGFGDQDSWMLAFALVGLIAIALTRPARRDPRLAGLIVFGGFLLCEAVFLSVSKGIVHPYYVSALAPGTAAMAGAGLAAIARLAHGQAAAGAGHEASSGHDAGAGHDADAGHDAGAGHEAGSRHDAGAGYEAGTRHRVRSAQGLLAVAAIATVVVQILLLHHAHYLRVWQLLLAPAAVAALIAGAALQRTRFSMASVGAVLAVLLVAPTAYAATTWRHPVEGTFPAAGPHVVSGNGGAELSQAQLATAESLMRYLVSHGGNGRMQLLTQASLTADSPILLGLRAAALGGYGGVDPALDGPGLARLISSGQARYLLLGGSYAYLGGNAASRAAARVCPQVPLADWGGVLAHETEGVYLLDCGGRARELAAQP